MFTIRTLLYPPSCRLLLPQDVRAKDRGLVTLVLGELGQALRERQAVLARQQQDSIALHPGSGAASSSCTGITKRPRVHSTCSAITREGNKSSSRSTCDASGGVGTGDWSLLASSLPEEANH